MMALQSYPNQIRKFLFLNFVALALTIACTSCRVTMVAPYDEAIVQQTEIIAKKIDKLYLTMLETSVNENNGRTYDKFAEDYIDIEVELNSLVNKNRMRPLNRESVRNCEIALETWLKHKEEHKKNQGINDVDIDLNRDFFRDLFMVIQIGESTKNKVTHGI